MTVRATAIHAPSSARETVHFAKVFLAKRTTSFRSGVEYGLGKGFLSAGLTNFRSLPNLFAPFLWATTYRLGTARGIPQAMFWARVTGETDTS